MTETETHSRKIEELEIAELEGVSGGNVVSGGANKNAALGFGSNAKLASKSSLPPSKGRSLGRS
jgi:hypothetical protein